MLGRKEKGKTRKTNNTTRGNKSKGIGERMRTKKISRQNKTVQTKQDIPKQRKKILPASLGRMHQHMLTTGGEGNNTKYGNKESITEKLNG